MRTFFEQELEKLFGDGEIIRSPEFAGRACVGTIGKNLRVHASFITMGIADPDNPAQDQAAREMGLRLVESCRQVNVYGPEWTDGMWAEIHHAMKLGIPVMSDQKTIGRTPPRQRANTKERRMTR